MPTLATITYKNQLTIPKKIVDALNLERIKKVLVSMENGSLILKPLASRVEFLAGSLSYLVPKKPANLKKIRIETQKKIAQEVAKEGL